MPPAAHIAVPIDSLQSIELRPCLRAAIRLERQYGFPALVRGISEGSVTILSDIVRECAASRDDAAAILALRPIGKLVNTIAPVCQSIVPALAGHDDSKSHTAEASKPIPFAEYFAQLFKIATGAIGWTPQEAYAATPAEIVAAMTGRTELLQALFGTAEKPAEAPKPLDPTTDAAVHSAGIARLRELLGSAG